MLKWFKRYSSFKWYLSWDSFRDCNFKQAIELGFKKVISIEIDKTLLSMERIWKWN